ncbi:magnesium transporter CorA family protein [Candidatus Saccharibacteria bacterium]|nr:magnesium transporter CorA family protein [Candidatus Saccharibacteria bacterium]
MIQYLKSSAQKPHLTEMPSYQKGSWLRLENPTPAEVDEIVERLGLDRDIVTDALDPYEIPRIELVNRTTYFIIRIPRADNATNDFSIPLMFIMHQDCLVSICRESLQRIWQPFIEATGAITTQRSQLLILMLEDIVKNYQQKIAIINKEMRVATTDIMKLKPKDIAVFVEHERILNDYLDALLPSNDALEKLLGGNYIKIFQDDKELVEDLSIEFEQIIARCKSLLRTITSTRDSYRALMDTRLNESIWLLTIITLAFTVPTMIAGLYGMNVKLPGNVDSPLTFWVIVLISALTSASLAYYFLKKRR